MSSRVNELFEMLGKNPPESEVAASELLLHPEWLVGEPPPQLSKALEAIAYDSQSPIFQLAREWESVAMSEALLKSFSDGSNEQSKEHNAWLVKHIIGPSQLEAVVRIALSEEAAGVRRFFIEALDRLTFARQIDWNQTKDIINKLKNDPDSGIREGIVGILMSLKDRKEKLSILTDMLSDSNDFVVASAANAISQMEGKNLDRGLLNDLLCHPSLLVREMARNILNNR